jgi:hypothetical protein
MLFKIISLITLATMTEETLYLPLTQSVYLVK